MPEYNFTVRDCDNCIQRVFLNSDAHQNQLLFSNMIKT